MTAGLSHHEAVIAIYAIQAGMVGLAYLLRWQSDTLVVPLYLSLAGVVLALFIAAGHGLIPTPAPQNARGRSDRWRLDLLSGSWLRDLPIRFLGAVVPLFLIASVFLPAHVPDDVGYVSIALFGIVLFGLSLLPRLAPYFVRGGLYMGSTFLLYVSDAVWMPAISAAAITYHILFGAMAVMVLLSLRFDSQRWFNMTPLDYLMVILALIVPFLSDVSMDSSAFGLFMAKLIVLFFSFELLLRAFSDRVKQLGLVSLWVLLGLAIRVWL